MSTAAESPPPPTGGSARAAWWVGAGIFLSRIAGFVRQAVFSYFFGNTAVADVWVAALRTPNVIQNLLGEGALSASFIPVYSELLGEGREEDAGRFAGAALGILASVAFGAALVGMLIAPFMVPLFFPEWEPWQHELGVLLVRILSLMTAVLVVSAWALGVLNSHRRFFVSYVAPVAWNVAIVGAMLGFGLWVVREPESLIVWVAWGALGGALLQVVVQLPWLLPALRHFRLSIDRNVTGVREAIRNFIPVVTARGVVNLSGWVDIILAGLLATGALAALFNAQMLYVLPISLFGMSIAASELPELSRARALARELLVPRVQAALRRVAFLLVPSALAYLLLGDVLIGALLERGIFLRVDTVLVYAILAAYSLGLPASASSRVLSSAYYALRDTRTPARLAYARVALSLLVGVALMFPLDRVAIEVAGETRQLGGMGLAMGASVGAWVEYLLLRRRLGATLGPHGPGRGPTLRILAAGGAAAGAAVLAKLVLGSLFPAHEGLLGEWVGALGWAGPPLLAAGTALAFGVTYLTAASALGVGVPVRRLLRR